MSYLDDDQDHEDEYFIDDLRAQRSLALEDDNKRYSGQSQLKEYFQSTQPNLIASKELADKLLEFQIKFITKNKDHIEFFGGNLTGVQVVRFTPSDMDKFFSDVLEIDDIDVKEGLHQLPCIHQDRLVTSDTFNNTCMYVIHLFLSSNLPEKIVNQGALATGLILFYRYLTSLMSNGFQFPASQEYATATYAALSNKFILKQLGSWNAVLEVRTLDLIAPGKIHYETLKSYQDDKKILYAISDSQGRIRDIFKNIYAKYIEIYKNGRKVKTTSNNFEFEGEKFLKDKTKNLTVYVNYINSIVEDKQSFIKQEIVDVTVDLVQTASPNLVIESLEWISNNVKYSTQKEIREFLELTLVHCFNYIKNNKTVVSRTHDLISLVIKLKGVYMSSRSTEEDLIRLRNIGEKLIRKATEKKNSSLLSSVRTCVLLYIVIRALSMNYYS